MKPEGLASLVSRAALLSACSSSEDDRWVSVRVSSTTGDLPSVSDSSVSPGGPFVDVLVDSKVLKSVFF
jgi:hypothetical protein